jgi:tetratricopeptide (TPR) repeat protein
LVLAVPLAAASYRRNLTWSDWFEFHHDCARKSPDKYRPQYNLGTHLGMHGRYFEAIPFLKKAISIRPGSSEAHNQLGAVYERINLPDKALLEYRQAVELGPKNAQAHYNLALLLDGRGRAQEAAAFYRRFVEIAPPGLEPYRKQVLQRLQALSLMQQVLSTTVGDEVSASEP